jgi:hypothetical protein
MPSIIFGIRIGATITFGIIVLKCLYEANEEYHRAREEYLKSCLKNIKKNNDNFL